MVLVFRQLFENCTSSLGPVSRKSRELFGPEKPFVKLRPAYSVKLIFSHVVKGIKIKIMAKFRASRRLRFEDTKRIMSPEIRPKSFGTFEKQAPVHPGVSVGTSGKFCTLLCTNIPSGVGGGSNSFFMLRKLGKQQRRGTFHRLVISCPNYFRSFSVNIPKLVQVFRKHRKFVVQKKVRSLDRYTC